MDEFYGEEILVKVNQLERELKHTKEKLSECMNEMEVLKGQGRVGNDQIIQIADRVARLEMVDETRRYFNKLPPPTEGKIVLQNGQHEYTPEMEAAIRNGAPYCTDLSIREFADYPPEFYNELINDFRETKKTGDMVANLNFAFAVNNPAPWPAVLVQLHVADLGLSQDVMPTLTEKVDYDNKMVVYTLRNKHNPGVGFKLSVHFEGKVKCYQKMTRFTAQVVPM